MLTIKTHLKSLVTSSLYLSNVGTLVLRDILLMRSRPLPGTNLRLIPVRSHPH